MERSHIHVLMPVAPISWPRPTFMNWTRNGRQYRAVINTKKALSLKFRRDVADEMKFDEMNDAEGMIGDDDTRLFGSSSVTLTAHHLFCLAAMEDPPKEIVQEFSCAASTRKRKTLLDLWTAARAQISDTGLLKKLLGLAQEQKSQTILDRTYDLWAPTGDTGMTYMVNTLNNELRETLNALEPSLGEGKLFVDVGSG